MNQVSRYYLKQLIRQKVLAAKARGRSVKIPRLRKPRRPIGIEKEYTVELEGIVETFREIFALQVLPKLPAIVAKAQAPRPKKDGADMRNDDDYSDDIERMMNSVEISYQNTYPPERLAGMTAKIGMKTNRFSKAQTEAQIKAIVGTDVFVSEPWLAAEMKAFVRENVGLISKWSDTLKVQAEEIITRGARGGATVDDIAEELEDRINVTESRYDMIARDQVNKFNGQLNMIRQADLGIERYKWDTSHDERVRPMHAELDGEIFSWSEPPVTNPQGDRNNPGEDYNCRCSALAVIEDIVGEISDEIDESDREAFEAEFGDDDDED